MQKICSTLLFASLAIFGGCQKYYISIAEETINRDYLASTHVHTPDPRQENPPEGQQLIIEWKIPRELISKEPKLYLHVIYKNYTEEYFSYPMFYKLGYAVYRLLGKEFQEKQGILTYDVKVETTTGETFLTWKHQLSTKLIVIPDVKEIDPIKEEQEEREEEWGQFPAHPLE